MTQNLLLGQTLSFAADPFKSNWQDAVDFDSNGAVLIEDGRIKAKGPAPKLRADFPQANVVDYGDKLINAGFVDAHMHYPQTAMIASWGKQLIDWLNTYTFPEESRFHDAAYAADIAGRTLDLALAHGTTTLASFCTIHTESVDAFFNAAASRNMAVVAGKTCMDRNAPDNLRDTAQSAYDDSKRLLEHWDKRGRARYAITPRFSPTSTPEQLHALGALWAENPDCLMQTHLSEQVAEIAWMKELFPKARDVHCPTSNAFIGSGLFDLMGLAQTNIRTGLATDTGGGSSFSMLHTMAAAYEIAQLRGTAIHPAQLIWLATVGSAKALKLQDEVGNLAVGSMADIIVLNLASTPAIAQRHANARDIWDALFPTIMMGDDRAIADVWVAGEKVSVPKP